MLAVKYPELKRALKDYKVKMKQMILDSNNDLSL